MPTRKPTAEPSSSKWATKCMGGQSFGCRHEEHEKSSRFPDITCYRCGVRMGCGYCCQMPRELVCLRCFDFGHPAGIKYHGHIEQSKEKRLEEIKQIAKGALPCGD